MIRIYFKTAWRNIWKNKQYSFLNIIGLSIGFAIVILISAWSLGEFEFNKEFKNYNRIGSLMVTGTFNGEKETDPICSPPFATTLRTKYANYFENVSILTHPISSIFSFGENKVEDLGVYADIDFLKIFRPEMLEGNYSSDFNKDEIYISQSLSKQMFGKINPIGQTLKMNGKDLLQVKGVYKDFSRQASFYKNVQFIASFEYYVSTLPNKDNVLQGWNQNMFTVYVNLKPSYTFERVSSAIKDMAAPFETDIHPEALIHPMSKWHLHSTFKNGKNVGGFISIVRLFMGVGLGILLLVVFNFVNLTTAHNMNRTSEVGIRKAIGASRRSLICQFLIESFLYVLISGVLAICLAFLSAPLFDKFAHIVIPMNFTDYRLMSLYSLVLLVSVVLGGFYPAFYLSSFAAVKVLKGQAIIERKNILRKSLIVFQFFIATVLVFLTIIVWKQIYFVKSRPPGYTTNGLVYFNSKDEGLLKHFDAFKNELIHSNAVVNVANSSAPVQQMNLSSGGFDWKGSGEKQNAIFGTTKISPEFANTVHWQFIHGRNFENNRPSDSAAIILNQAAADYMGKAAQIGQIINFREKDYTIVGIIKNPIMQGPFVNINPSVFFLNDEVQPFFTIRLNNKIATPEALDKIQNIYHKYSPDYPLNLLFVDAKYGEAFLSINQSAKLISIFSLLAIFIAVLGLYGLTAYAVEQKRKEIGIRKVLGASVIRLWNSFVKEFVLLLALSFIVAIPISLIIMRNWLASFDYRTEISPYLFLFGIVLSLIFALIAISGKILKAVRVNPVKNLRVE